jgi:drug/metabolite transporter (DMT)-like permease
VSLTAIVLIAVAAVAHATWNLMSKQAAASGTVAFVWLMAALSTALYGPVLAVYLLVWHPHLGRAVLVFLAGTAVLHTGYYLLLQRGYRSGDLSHMYPLARGSGLLLSSFTAILLYREHPGAAGTAGILLVAAGVIVLSLPGRGMTRGAAGAGGAAFGTVAGFGLLTGLFIAGYTLWDAYAVAHAHVPPLLEDVAACAGQTVLLAPLAAMNTGRLALMWRGYRRQVLGAAVLSPLAYILVLTALVFSPVSSIAPAREISVLVGVLLGRRLLGEGHTARRVAAAAAIAVGVTAIVLA